MPNRLESKAQTSENAPTKRISQNDFSHQMANFWSQIKNLRNLSMALHQTGVRAVLEYDQEEQNGSRDRSSKPLYAMEWDSDFFNDFGSENIQPEIRHWNNLSRQAASLQDSLYRLLTELLESDVGPSYARLARQASQLASSITSTMLLCDATSALGRNSNASAAQEIFDIRNALRGSYQSLQESNLVVARFAQQNPEFRFTENDFRRLQDEIANLKATIAELRRVDNKIQFKQD